MGTCRLVACDSVSVSQPGPARHGNVPGGPARRLRAQACQRALRLTLAGSMSLALSACVFEGAGEIRTLGYEYSPTDGVTLLLPRCDDPRGPEVVQVVTEDGGEVAVLEQGAGWTLDEQDDGMVWRVALSDPLPTGEPVFAIVLDDDGLETWYAPLLLDEAVGPSEVLDDDRSLTRSSVTTRELANKGCPPA